MPFRGQDITGQKFGRLTVIGLGDVNKHGHRTWKCSCECGSETQVYRSSLITGATKSCGCLRSEVSGANNRGKHMYRTPVGHTEARTVFARYRNNATSRNRNHVFDLTFDQFLEITSRPCHYCGVAPSQVQTSPHGRICL